MISKNIKVCVNYEFFSLKNYIKNRWEGYHRLLKTNKPH